MLPNLVQRLRKKLRCRHCCGCGAWGRKDDDFAAGQLELGEEIGRGAFSSAVRIARDRRSGETVAVKVFDARSGSDAIACAEREIATLRALPPHPNVAQFKGAFRIRRLRRKRRLLLATELLQGGSLLARMRAAPGGVLCEADAARAVADAVSALSHVHSHGIAHRDVSPLNLLFADTSPGSPLKLIDFGLCCAAGAAAGDADEACGTPAFAAPCQNCGDLRASDMWSVGAVAYTLLVGYPPFYEGHARAACDAGGSEAMLLLRKAEEEQQKRDVSWPPPSVLQVSDAARDFVQSLLRPRPEDRMTAQQALHHPWISPQLKGASL